MSLLIIFLINLLILGGFTNENDIIEIPITLTEGYGSFNPNFNTIDWNTNPPESEWGKTRVEVSGVPKDWKNVVVQRIWFDIEQFVYQSYKQGAVSKEFFNGLVRSWNMQVENDSYSSIPIKCYTHIVLGKDENDHTIYKIDTDNDRDFSEESVVYPIKYIRDKLDSLSQYAHQVSAEILKNGQIKETKIPVFITEMEDGVLLRNFPIYAEAEYQNQKLNITSSFCHLRFQKESSLCLSLKNGKTNSLVELNEVIEINNEFFENLGVDLNKRILRLKKVSNHKKIYSTQVGTYAKNFEGKDFLTNKSLKLGDFKGKYLLVDFWGSWCKPCIEEMPNLKYAYQNTEREIIDFIGIVHDNPESLTRYLKKDIIEWGQILSTESNNLVDIYGIKGFPSNFLIDPEGRIVAKELRGKNLLDTLNFYIK